MKIYVAIHNNVTKVTLFNMWNETLQYMYHMLQWSRTALKMTLLVEHIWERIYMLLLEMALPAEEQRIRCQCNGRRLTSKVVFCMLKQITPS